MRSPLVATALMVVAAGVFYPAWAAEPTMTHDHGHAMPPGDTGMPEPGGDVTVDFELLDHQGNVVRDEDFRGKVLLLTFGFTHCEHICPLMGATMGAVLRILDEPAAGVFISVDTERDTPTVTHRYAQVFNEKMVGLGGDYHTVNRAAENFGITYVVTKTRDNYTVQHTANIFLIDPLGELRETFPLNATVEEITAAIARIDH